MKNEAIPRITLSQQVAKKLEHEILVKLRPGDKLDTEPELARRFDVSMSTIREAISSFAQNGLLERRARRGTIVRERKAPSRHVALKAHLPCHSCLIFHKTLKASWDDIYIGL